MNNLLNARKTQRPVRFAHVAQNIMAPNPGSIDHTAKVQQAAAVLSDRSISAVPVINEAGRPVGVISRTDNYAKQLVQEEVRKATDLPIAENAVEVV